MTSGWTLGYLKTLDIINNRGGSVSNHRHCIHLSCSLAKKKQNSTPNNYRRKVSVSFACSKQTKFQIRTSTRTKQKGGSARYAHFSFTEHSPFSCLSESRCSMQATSFGIEWSNPAENCHWSSKSFGSLWACLSDVQQNAFIVFYTHSQNKYNSLLFTELFHSRPWCAVVWCWSCYPQRAHKIENIRLKHACVQNLWRT